MTGRQSLLEPKAEAALDDIWLVPRLNWRSWHTWAVFLGLGIALPLAATLVALLCAVVAAIALEDTTSRVVAGTAAAASLVFPGAFALKRAFPLRDTAGRRVPGNPDLDFGLPGANMAMRIAWLMSFVMISLAGLILAAKTVGVFAGRPPIEVSGVVIVSSVLFSQVPFRILGRAPVKAQEPDRDA